MNQITRKKRKPLTEAQKQERRERLAKARAAKKEKNGTEYSTVHPDVPRDLNHKLNVYNVREWIKENKGELVVLKQSLRRNGYDRKLKNQANIIECYVQNMESYLRSGVWLDSRYGMRREGHTTTRCVVPAIHDSGPHKGMMKISVGTSYPGIGMVTQEVYDEYYNIS